MEMALEMEMELAHEQVPLGQMQRQQANFLNVDFSH